MPRSIRVVVCQGESEVHNQVYHEDEVSFGKRELSNQVVLNAQGISRKHATITRSAEGLLLCDAKSTNGTYVNGERVEKFVLKGGEIIAIGPFQLRVFDEGGPKVREAADSETHIRFVQKETSEFLELIERDPSGQVSLDSLAPIEMPETPCDEPSLVEVVAQPHAKTSLALVYREAARRCGSPKWGYPGSEPENETLVLLKQGLAHTELDPGAQVEWYHRIGCELGGGGPLPTLLAEAAFDQMTICGTHPIEVERSGLRESLPTRYSCPEALAADLRRLLGDVGLGDESYCQVGTYSLRVLGSSLIDGLGVVVQRANTSSSPDASDSLFDGAKAYVDGLIRRNCSILVVGSSTVDLRQVQVALLGHIPENKSVTVLQREGNIQNPNVVRVDGFQPAEQVWRSVAQLNRSWLFVENLNPTDLSPLVACGRHFGGGTIVTIRASSVEYAVRRLQAYCVCAGVADVDHAERFVQSLFDSVLFVQGAVELSSVIELRSSGELVEIFVRDESGLRETGVESAVLK